MSNTDVPAASAGGGTGVPADRLPEDLPPKIRVHALAKLLGVTSRDVLAALNDIGNPVPSASSTVARAVVLRVAEMLLPEPAEPAEADPDELGDAALATPLVPVFAAPQPLFMPPQPVATPAKPARGGAWDDADDDAYDEAEQDADVDVDDAIAADQDEETLGGRRRRRRGRRGRGRGKGGAGEDGDEADEPDEAVTSTAASETSESYAVDDDQAEDDDEGAEADTDGSGTRRRRRRRRRKGTTEEEAPREDDPPNTVVHIRESRPAARASESDDGVQGVKGSTRLEAKRQRRRDGREAGRRRPPILSEAEFLARRESVDRTMVVREHEKARSENGTSVQIGVLEDGVLVEHFVTSAVSGSLVGNVYLGRVQNVLPSMEAAFVDIGRGRNAVLYAGEVDWDAAGLEGKARKIEQALSTGDSVLVQVTKDPVGHKGARLTTQISLAGRFLVYVPGGGATGISRKLPDTERRRLKEILKRIVPEDAGVIIRTASEGISEDALARDVRRLQAQWKVIKTKSEAASNGRSNAPALLYEEPDLLIKVVRDLFTEDFSALVVQGSGAWDTIDAYIRHVAPDLAPRLRRHVGPADVFTEFRIDEQITKALDRKVWLPSGGYLVIDRTEAMTVIDVNTGKFTGAGGNLEETVTRNNLEAAEEIVRQLRLRDIGGIIVIDFIDMVLESNRDLVLRRLTECLGRDRTRHQVAEVTSLGLVQMTRKRVGTGLIEAYSQLCEHCRGRGLIVTTEPADRQETPEPAAARRTRARGKAADGKAAEVKAAEVKAAEVKAAEVAAEAAEPVDVRVPDPRSPEAPAAAGAKEGSNGKSAAAEAAPSKPTGRSRRSRRAEAQAPVEPAEPPVAAAQAVDADLAGQAAPTQPAPDQPPSDLPSTGQPLTGQPAASSESLTGLPSTTADVAASPAGGAGPAEGAAGSSTGDTAVPEDATDAPGGRRSRRRRAASRPAGPPVAEEAPPADNELPVTRDVSQVG
ncbi:MAG TPA: Rne/Rng family ribonuclease [Pseudonocardiaceae bacterium]|nr:Rne/Rng family ribonuclease [Pseudonocardiaceae bacterium]